MTDGFFSDYVCLLCAFVFEWALLVLVTVKGLFQEDVCL